MKRKITPKAQYTTYASYPLVAGDVRAYEICLDLGENAQNAEFKITAIRADGYVLEDIGTVKEGIATYTMASDMYSVPGELTVRLAVVEDASVLTDREIVFEVIGNAVSVDKAQTVVPINDSVILRLATVEQTISAKVDKIAGKTLSSNDFTDGYKEKLDNLDDTIGSEVERISETVDDLSDEFDLYKEDVTSKLSLKADKTTTDDLQRQVDNKADKSDITGVYRFRGSVENIEDVLIKYQCIIAGNPTLNGKVVGYYDSDKIYITEDIEVSNYNLRIPIKPIILKPGTYNVGSIFIDVNGANYGDNILNITEQTVITEVGFGSGYTLEVEAGQELALFWLDYIYVGENSYNGGTETGDVYNETSSGMNYAWNGTEWDALGGEHRDIEAREQIEALSTTLEEQTSDIETALDSIIEIQNSLIGGDGV